MSTDELEMKIVAVEECGDLEMYIETDGKQIAKRGHPGTRHARTWKAGWEPLQ